ncbi:subtilisin-like protein [Annulohypoxylon truncatum]|uniref:subtilisin-like protein n=1 Tax=Annulohypoxylon truncatum TaxID=327061 RepID=UPI002007A74D|nr:subtilisin-like protein [Annulohypoxylon truncatum]KAI1208007.1 subtilisin-like protein [Annulohypoxylon truncatum]
MKTVYCFLTVLAPFVLAKAPLVNRGVSDGIADNYIVVMKKADSKTLQAHYRQIHTTSQRINDGNQGVVRTYQVQDFNGYHIECDNATLESIRNNPGVDYVAQDGRVTAQSAIPTNVPRSGPTANTWGLGRISHRDAGIPVYVDENNAPTFAYMLDTGIRVTHQEFGGRAIWGQNFITGSQNIDDNGHGTHTAATVGGNTVGVDNSTKLIAVKVLDQNSSGAWSGMIAGIQWAVNDAQSQGRITRSVINMSIGGPKFQPLNDCVKSAVDAGMTVVAAACNYGVDACTYSPASAPEAITVAAVDISDTRPNWSNYGACVNIFGPGDNIYSAWKDSDTSYQVLSGTSMASPHVAGLVTYLFSREFISGQTEVNNRLIQLGTENKVQNPNGSPNLIAFNGNKDEL